MKINHIYLHFQNTNNFGQIEDNIIAIFHKNLCEVKFWLSFG